MADNTVLNPGSGGDSMRTLEDASGKKWPASVLCYATTVSPGANVLQFVDASHGLPVAVVGAVEVSQATAANLNATVSQAGSWTVGISGGASVGISGAVTVQQATAANLKAEVSQGTAANLNATVVQATAANLKATVTQAGPVTVQQSTAANLLATVSQGGTWTVGLSGGTTVGVSGTVAVTKSGTWSVGLDAGAKVGLSAGDALVGRVSAGTNSGLLYSGTTPLTRKFAKISASASGNNSIIAASSGNRIRVLRWGLTANGDVGIKWRSGSSTDLTGVRPLTKYASAGGAYTPVGIFETAKNEALNLNLDAAVAVGGELTYVEVPESGGVVPGEPGSGDPGAI